MLLVDAIDLGLHVGMPTLDLDGEFGRPERNQSKRISSAGRLAKASASAARASLRGVTRRPPIRTVESRRSEWSEMSSEKSLPPPDKASEIEIEIRVKGRIDEAALQKMLAALRGMR
jgi:hypothetical protein